MPKCDVTQLYVLTRIRQDVSSGTCVARMLSLPRQHIWCCHEVISASAAIANLLIVLACFGICNTRVIRGYWMCRTSRLLRRSFARLRLWRIFAFFGSPSRKRTLFLVGNLDSKYLHRIARKCVVQDKNMCIRRLPHHAQIFCSRDHTRHSRLSFALAMIPKNASFEWNGIFTQHIKGYRYWSY